MWNILRGTKALFWNQKKKMNTYPGKGTCPRYEVGAIKTQIIWGKIHVGPINFDFFHFVLKKSAPIAYMERVVERVS
jgi:hypothetical protein